ncbi:MFS transporter, partial [Streptomyces inhibens]
GAAAVAGELPGRAGEALLTAARTAFTDGLQVAVLGAAGVMVCAAVLAVALLRGLHTKGVEGETDADGVAGAAGAADGRPAAAVPAGTDPAGTPAG